MNNNTAQAAKVEDENKQFVDGVKISPDGVGDECKTIVVLTTKQN